MSNNYLNNQDNLNKLSLVFKKYYNWFTNEYPNILTKIESVEFKKPLSPGHSDSGFFLTIKNNENQKKTNLYIYRQELITRKNVIDVRPENFKNILNIPNLDVRLFQFHLQ